MNPTVYDEAELVARATKAYFRNAGHPSPDQPCRHSSDVGEEGGELVVTLRNVNGDLARYRYDAGRDRLRRLVPAGD